MTIQKLRKEADKWFSLYIRLRQADKMGWIRCYTCRKPIYWTEAECSHFKDRRYLLFRYDEKNAKACCHRCNCVLDGNKVKYEQKLRKEYGDEVVNNLINNQAIVKLSIPDYEVMIRGYRMKVKELKQGKKT